jgi:hypothetical protein
MLSRSFNLEHLNIGLDKRAIEDEWPNTRSASAIWLVIAYKKYWRLLTLCLRGLAVDTMTVNHFLNCHKDTLNGARFSNCYLAGSWVYALDTMRSSSTLRWLALDQVSQNLQRVVWSTPYAGYITNKNFLEDEDRDEWVYVTYVGFSSIILEFDGRHIAESLSEGLERFHLSSRQANPFVPDALDWFNECLEL